LRDVPQEEILYFGAYHLPEVAEQRRLPGRNIAGTNRMRRLAEAMVQCGARVHIVSSAVSLRCGLYPGILHSADRRMDGVLPITTVPSLGVPVLGALCEPFLLIGWTLLYLLRHRVSVVIVYGFYPTFALLCVVLRVLRLRVISQIEDVSVPKWSDFSRNRAARPMQQLILWPCMKLVTVVAHAVVVPTRRFEAVLPRRKRRLVITGCMRRDPAAQGADMDKLHDGRLDVLFAGRHTDDSGLDVLLGLLRALREDPDLGRRFRIHSCGTKSYPQELVSLARDSGDGLDVRLHGILSDKDYRDLLHRVHIGLALQVSRGRFGNFKTPSKAYEFLGLGKLVIAYDVGDLADLSPDRLVLLRQETAAELVEAFRDVAHHPARYTRICSAGLAHSRSEYAYARCGKELLHLLTGASPDRSGCEVLDEVLS